MFKTRYKTKHRETKTMAKLEPLKTHKELKTLFGVIKYFQKIATELIKRTNNLPKLFKKKTLKGVVTL